MKLTSLGEDLKNSSSPETLGLLLGSRLRLFAETLLAIDQAPRNIEALDEHLRSHYQTDWTSLGGIRARTDWLDALGAIEAVGDRRWKITLVGEAILAQCQVVTPEALFSAPTNEISLITAPKEIKDLLSELETGVRAQASRSTYNIWVPSPPDRSNKVENLRVVANAAIDPIERGELLQFIATTFSLRRSSVESMLPFLRASGVLSEVGLGIFQATPAAQAWLRSNNDVNFIRILHANMRFVGEMLQASKDGSDRTEIYEEAKKFGLNTDKARWIAALLRDAELIEEPKRGGLRTTSLGLALLAELPIDAVPGTEEQPSEIQLQGAHQQNFLHVSSHAQLLTEMSRTPNAGGMASGLAFELAIRDAFAAMGFDARNIGGPGATDVLVRWVDADGRESTAIIEAKSRTSGAISPNEVGVVSLETHKANYDADYVAIIAPGFVGDTIRAMAAKRGWSLIEASQLGLVADEAIALGIEPLDIARLFVTPAGLEAVKKDITRRKRELSVLSFAIEQIVREAALSQDGISPREIHRSGRDSALQPSIEEVLVAVSRLEATAPGAIRLRDENNNPQLSSYLPGQLRASASGLRALADAIEAGHQAVR